MKWIKEKIRKFKNWIVGILGIGIASAMILSVGAPANNIDSLNTLNQLEEAYFQQNGRYLQIIPGNKLPHYESGTVAQKLGKNIDPSWRVNIYEAPGGKHGYQVIWEDNTYVYSKGYGNEAESRTYQHLKSELRKQP